ncbi:hypothetical protein C0V97_11070 [Asaia sp. W19]|uniref:hypothetical protein n=1 Tax=unclassified Asaia TaxID=2685023 RepID=UPI000F8CC03A|nr:hypothetical protein [Asaia sp. W19]RUT25468.1 hypothetical protein C0V97_11070 [Asaia sp. W19]
MKRPWLAAGLCLVVIGLGGIGVRHESKAELQRALASFRANLPPDARFEYDRAYPRFLARGAGFDNARFIRGDVTLSAQHLTINNPTGYLTTGLSFSRIHADRVNIVGPVSGTIGELTLKNLLLPPFSREKREVAELPPASQIHFRHGQIHDIALVSEQGCTLNIGYASLDNYGHDDGNAGSLHEGHASCSNKSKLALALSRAIHQPATALALDIRDMHETGTRYARYVGWWEQFASNPSPDHLATLQDVQETPARAETKGVALTLLGARISSESSEARRWKEGAVIQTRGEARTTLLSLSPASPLALFLPPVTHIDMMTQNITTDTTTRLSTIVFAALTPKSFAFEGRIAMDNLESSDATHQPALISTDLTYRDDGGNLDTLMTRIAAQRNQSLSDLKQMMALPAALLVQKVPGLSALPEFLQAPTGRSFTLSFHPPIKLNGENLKNLSTPLAKDPAMREAWSSPPILSSTLN